MQSTAKQIPFFFMGKRYDVSEGITILKAVEYAGYRLIRGCGCRSGFCGACATVYRTPGDYRLRVGLACKTLVEPGMYLSMIPFFPAGKALYDLQKLEFTPEQLFQLYPEVLRCLSCGACTKACPQGIDVRDYIADAMKGDIPAVANKAFECLMCGLCVARCPVNIPQYNVALLARRLYGRQLAADSPHLSRRVAEIREGRFDSPMNSMVTLDEERVKELYADRDIAELSAEDLD